MTWLINIDASILLWIQENLRTDFWTPFWKAVTALGNGGWFWVVLAISLLCFKSTRKAGLMSLLSMGLGALITNLILKPGIARIRPYEVVDGLTRLIGKPSDYSFPSGHTCAAFACALILWRVLPGRKGLPALILAVLVAFSRLYLGVHYPSDVLGGFLVAWFSSTVVCLAVRHYEREKR